MASFLDELDVGGRLLIDQTFGTSLTKSEIDAQYPGNGVSESQLVNQGVAAETELGGDAASAAKKVEDAASSFAGFVKWIVVGAVAIVAVVYSGPILAVAKKAVKG